MFRHWDIPGLAKRRYGSEGDGGYVILDAPLGSKHLIGYGVDKDVSFENQLTSSWGIKAHVFDHTIDQTPEVGPNVTYVKEGLGTRDAGELRSLATHVKAYVPKGADYILKIDIEGAEWNVLATADLSRVTQLIVELHDLHEDYSKILKRINKNFYLVHAHGNNCHKQPWVITDRVSKIPRYLECTWVRKNLVRGAVLSDDALPGPLDIPNDPNTPDMALDFWKRQAAPVSFVAPHHEKYLRTLMIPGDEVVATEAEARNKFIFILKEFDVFPIQIIMSLHMYDFSLEFPVAINGSFQEYELRYIKKGNEFVKGQSKTPIYTLKYLQAYMS
jgi:hypothetical protein